MTNSKAWGNCVEQWRKFSEIRGLWIDWRRTENLCWVFEWNIGCKVKVPAYRKNGDNWRIGCRNLEYVYVDMFEIMEDGDILGISGGAENGTGWGPGGELSITTIIAEHRRQNGAMKEQGQFISWTLWGCWAWIGWYTGYVKNNRIW